MIPTKPPASWFADPGFDRLSALTVTGDGRVLGHLAGWGTCHTGYPDECVTAPRSPSGYAYFMLGEVECDDGSRVPVGQITMHTGHAPLSMNADRARAHYDDTSVCAADVAMGEDEYGPWLAGALRPDVSDEDRRALSAAKLSGDWRRQDGGLELVAVLAVNSPGFPIPRARVASADTGSTALALVAAGVQPPKRDDPAYQRGLAVLHARATGGLDGLHSLANR